MEQHGKNETLCRVCGDKASGKHYGVPSCDGCRGFFKRSIRRNLDYVCKENGRCIVDVTRRNQCQACRFNKCLQVNMKKDAVQHERAPRNSLSSHHHHHHHYTGGGTLPLRTRSTAPLYHPSLLEPALCTSISGSMQPPICPTLQPAAAVAAAAYLQQQLLQSYTAPFKTTNNTAVTSFVAPPTIGLHFQLQSLGSPPLSPTDIHNVHQMPQTPSQHIIQTPPHPPTSCAKEDEVTSSEEAKPFPELEQDQNNDAGSYRTANDQTITSPTPSVSNGSRLRPIDLACLTLSPAENIYESAAKLLFLAVKWARSIPSFLQLTFQDQSILLEEAWSELFVLSAAQWALPVDEEYLVAGAVAPVSRHVALSEDARKLRDIIARFALLRVDHTEFACLKALVLFKAEVRGLRDTVQVELLQDQTHVMLNEYCAVRHKARFGKLLLLLPSVGGLSRQSLEELFFRKTVGDVPIERLLGDMVKSTNISVTSLNPV